MGTHPGESGGRVRRAVFGWGDQYVQSLGTGGRKVQGEECDSGVGFWAWRGWAVILFSPECKRKSSTSDMKKT